MLVGLAAQFQTIRLLLREALSPRLFDGQYYSRSAEGSASHGRCGNRARDRKVADSYRKPTRTYIQKNRSQRKTAIGTMPQVTANNCDFYYELEGSGEPIVFIHGETHGTLLFEDQFPHFARSYRCLTYDRRGHGKSSVPLYGYSLWNQTHDLKCLLDHFGFERVIVVAVAMSTTIGASFTLQYPERVRALALCSWYELEGFPLLERRRKAHQMSFADLHLKMRDILLETRTPGPRRLHRGKLFVAFAYIPAGQARGTS